MNPRRVVPFGRPWVTDADRNAVHNVLSGHILTHGPEGKAFEAEFAAFLGGEAYCVSVSSGMAALHLAYLHWGIGPGDEVIVPAQTHTATAHAVELVGAKCVFVDCDPATGNVTPDTICAAFTSRTRAVSLVHFVGVPCAMRDIVALAEARGVKVVEDCALALGARYDGKHVGLWGDAGCFSFYPVKHITTGEGGMFVTRHREVAAAVAQWRAFGVDRTHSERALPGMYEVATLGMNYRMGEMPAALGRAQLSRIDQNLSMRNANFTTLKRALAALDGVRIIDTDDARAQNSHYCLTVVLEGRLAPLRNEVASRMNALGVGTSVYYPHPVPRMSYYRQKYGYTPASFVAATRISDCSLALPVGPHVEQADIAYIAETVRCVLRDAAKDA